MKKTKKILISFLLITLLTPSVAFASWWNPFSWFQEKNKIEITSEISTSTPITIPELKTESTWWNPFSWDKKTSVMQEKEVIPEVENKDIKTEPKYINEKTQLEIETTKAEAEKYRFQAEQTRLEMEKLKQQNTTQTQTQTEANQEENKNTTITLPNGAIVEMDEYGNITKTIKEATYIPTEPTQATQQTNQNQTQNNTTEFKIISINVTPEVVSVTIEWETSTPTTGKVFITGENMSSKVFNSESGLSTRHVVSISNLTGEASYSYEIENIDNLNNVLKKSGNFTTIEMQSTVDTNPPVILGLQLYSSSYYDFNLRSNEEIDISNIKFYKIRDIVKSEEEIETHGCGISHAGVCVTQVYDILLPIQMTADDYYTSRSGKSSMGGYTNYYIYRGLLSKHLSEFSDSNIDNGAFYFQISIPDMSGNITNLQRQYKGQPIQI